jgi:hypothetical protein
MAGRIVRQRTKDSKPEFCVKAGCLEIEGVQKNGIAALLDCQFLGSFYQLTPDSLSAGLFINEKSLNKEMVPMGPTEQSADEAACL